LLSFSPNIFFLFVSYKKLEIKIYKTVTLTVVLYRCGTWSLILREEHRLKVFEKTVLRIFEPKREEDGSWRTLHNDEFTACILHRILLG
jgi:hypothetical protein